MKSLPDDVAQVIFRRLAFPDLYSLHQCLKTSALRKEVKRCIRMLQNWAASIVNQNFSTQSMNYFIDFSTPLSFSKTVHSLDWNRDIPAPPCGTSLFSELRYLRFKNIAWIPRNNILANDVFFSNSIQRLELLGMHFDLSKYTGSLPRLSELIICHNPLLTDLPHWVSQAPFLQGLHILNCRNLRNISYALMHRLSKSTRCDMWNDLFQRRISSMNKTQFDVFQGRDIEELKLRMRINDENKKHVACISLKDTNPQVERNLHDTIMSDFPALIYQQVLLGLNA